VITLAEFDADEVLSKVGKASGRSVRFEAGGETYSVSMGSARYRVFVRDGKTCLCCGRRGVKMLLQKHRMDDPKPHFNLYAYDSEKGPILMTKDHIVPKSRGGSNRLDNLQTMCAPCNESKGAHVPPRHRRSGRRRVYRNYPLRRKKPFD
jgi:5-methylcytosine-specific restriction endonuclease McrA